MEIGVKQAAELLNVSDKTIYRWVSGARIPFYRVGSQYRFSRKELLSWAAVDSVPDVEMPQEADLATCSLKESLVSGGIIYRVGGRDVRAVFEQMLGMMRLPPGANSDEILNRLYERERIMPTAVGDGIAFPHCRDMAISGLSIPMISLGFLEQPVDFSAIDKKPVDIVFVLLSPSSTASIRIMSRLAYAVRQPAVARLLHETGSRDQILEAVGAVDEKLDG